MLPSTPTPPHFDEPRWEFTKRMELSRDDHRPAEGVRRGARAASSSRRRSRSRRSSCSRRSAYPLYKIASGEVTNPPLLEAVAATGQAGAALDRHVRARGRRARARGSCATAARELLVLQCTSTYPCPPEQVNLRAMAAMGERFGAPVRALRPHAGHLHLDRRRRARRGRRSRSTSRSRSGSTGPTTTRRSTPEELARLVDGVRQVEAALGTAEKERDPALDPARATFEKSVVAEVAIPAGADARAGDADHEAARQRDPRAPARARSSAAGRRATIDAEPRCWRTADLA